MCHTWEIVNYEKLAVMCYTWEIVNYEKRAVICHTWELFVTDDYRSIVSLSFHNIFLM